jgi:hypothetical protein
MSHALHSDAVYVGIDVAKAELVLDVRPTPAPWAATNDAAGVPRRGPAPGGRRGSALSIRVEKSMAV